MERPRTLGELKASGWRSRSVRDEMRENLIQRLGEGAPVFPGIVGFDETVVPQIQNAVLSGHSFILLGLRGQAKTRLVRALVELLDEWQPVVEGSELNEDPLAPISVPTLRQRDELGDELPVTWIHRSERYREKLATPDVTIADLIGDVDPIKAATRRLTFADPEVVHYGIVPRSNRGIFAINELPDLPARIQVGLFNILEEGDLQIRGFPVRLPMDLCMVFTANPEDYTNRGSIITPLRDRIASQILTHYPVSREESMAITDQEAWVERPGARPLEIPDYVREMVDQAAFEARQSEFVDQGSGVSARMTISLYENVASNAERRALLNDEPRSVARVADLFAGVSAVCGKLELVYDGEREGVKAVAERILGQAVKTVFDERFPDAYAGEGDGEGPVFDPVLRWFQEGGEVELTDHLSSQELLSRLDEVPGLRQVATHYLSLEGEPHIAAAMEFVLEGLTQSSLLAREELIGGRRYRDILSEMAESLRD